MKGESLKGGHDLIGPAHAFEPKENMLLNTFLSQNQQLDSGLHDTRSASAVGRTISPPPS